jgi:hypothetical protein
LNEDSDPIPLESDMPLTPDEIRHMRRLMLDDDRATWLRKQVKVWLPWLLTIVAGLWAFIDWVMKHVKWGGTP